MSSEELYENEPTPIDKPNPWSLWFVWRAFYTFYATNGYQNQLTKEQEQERTRMFGW